MKSSQGSEIMNESARLRNRQAESCCIKGAVNCAPRMDVWLKD